MLDVTDHITAFHAILQMAGGHKKINENIFYVTYTNSKDD